MLWIDNKDQRGWLVLHAGDRPDIPGGKSEKFDRPASRRVLSPEELKSWERTTMSREISEEFPSVDPGEIDIQAHDFIQLTSRQTNRGHAMFLGRYRGRVDLSAISSEHTSAELLDSASFGKIMKNLYKGNKDMNDWASNLWKKWSKLMSVYVGAQLPPAKSLAEASRELREAIGVPNPKPKRKHTHPRRQSDTKKGGAQQLQLDEIMAIAAKSWGISEKPPEPSPISVLFAPS